MAPGVTNPLRATSAPLAHRLPPDPESTTQSQDSDPPSREPRGVQTSGWGSTLRHLNHNGFRIGRFLAFCELSLVGTLTANRGRLRRQRKGRLPSSGRGAVRGTGWTVVRPSHLLRHGRNVTEVSPSKRWRAACEGGLGHG